MNKLVPRSADFRIEEPDIRQFKPTLSEHGSVDLYRAPNPVSIPNLSLSNVFHDDNHRLSYPAQFLHQPFKHCVICIVLQHGNSKTDIHSLSRIWQVRTARCAHSDRVLGWVIASSLKPFL